MAYEFKKLGDVEALDEVPENANALIEVDGAIKRVPGSNLGGGCTDFWCGEWDSTAGGYWIMPTEDAEEPITYAEFTEALEKGAVQLLYSYTNDGSIIGTAYNVLACVQPSTSLQNSWYLYDWNSLLLFSDTIFDASPASLTETEDDTATTKQRDPWPHRG